MKELIEKIMRADLVEIYQIESGPARYETLLHKWEGRDKYSDRWESLKLAREFAELASRRANPEELQPVFRKQSLAREAAGADRALFEVSKMLKAANDPRYAEFCKAWTAAILPLQQDTYEHAPGQPVGVPMVFDDP